MNDTPPPRHKTRLIQPLAAGARAVLADASALFLPDEGDQATISRATLDRLRAALEEYDAGLTGKAGTALLEMVVIDKNTPLLEVSVAIPPAEAQPLARALAAAIKKTAVVSKRSAGAGKTIYFSNPKDKKTGFLSESARIPIFLKGKLWPTVRHYYLAQKYAGTELEDQIRLAISPAAAAAMARGSNLPVRPDWPQAKVDVMREALGTKFGSKKLRGLLLETGEARLVNHSRNPFWGDGLDGQGKNSLGQLLMALRTRLREESGAPGGAPSNLKRLSDG